MAGKLLCYMRQSHWTWDFSSIRYMDQLFWPRMDRADIIWTLPHRTGGDLDDMWAGPGLVQRLV